MNFNMFLKNCYIEDTVYVRTYMKAKEGKDFLKVHKMHSVLIGSKEVFGVKLISDDFIYI